MPSLAVFNNPDPLFKKKNPPDQDGLVMRVMCRGRT